MALCQVYTLTSFRDKAAICYLVVVVLLWTGGVIVLVYCGGMLSIRTDVNVNNRS